MSNNNYNYNLISNMDNDGNTSIDDNNSVTGDHIVNGRGDLPSTNSSQQLVSSISSVDDNLTSNNTTTQQALSFSTMSKANWFTMGVLCYVNLINYMDRFTIAGVLTDIQDDFKIGDDEGGLLQTAFVLSYMIFAPIFGYLGDRHSRKWIMAIGVFIWSGTTLMGSYMTEFGWFITFRSLVGLGEASYSTIAPTIISDLFVDSMRSKMLAMFYFAIPVGSGLGYIVGSETANALGSWRWALRVTPILGGIAVALLFLTKEPQRGQSEGNVHLRATTYAADLKDLVKNRSFMLSTGGFTCVAFVAGALSWWGPKFMHLGLSLQPGNENLKLNEVSFMFGTLTMISGIIGVPLGSYLSTILIKKYSAIDPIICACGLLISVPLLTAAMIVVTKNTILAYSLVFLGELALNLNWAIVADILLYVVIPTRRSTAEAFQILISHAFGDAGSPYLVGLISEAIKKLFRNSATSLTIASPLAIPSFSLTKEPIIQSIANITLTQHIGNLTQTLEHNIGNLTQKLEVNIGNLTQKLEDNIGNVTHHMMINETLSMADTPEMKFQALQYALFSTSFVEVLGAIFFLLTAIYLVRDKTRASQNARINQDYSDDSTTSVDSIDLPLNPRV